MMRKKKGQSGQAIIEYVLLLSLIFTIWITVMSGLKKHDVYETVFGKPWVRLANQIEYGIPSDSDAVKAKHPSGWARHSTNAGQ